MDTQIFFHALGMALLTVGALLTLGIWIEFWVSRINNKGEDK